jgi:hypothetical protein
VTKGVSKRGHNKQEMDRLNRTALIIGGSVAAIILVLMIVSFLT